MKLFRDNIHHENRIKKIAYELNIPEAIVEETISIMYDYIRLKFNQIEIPDETKLMTEEEFNKVFPQILIPRLGTFKPSYKKYWYQMKNKYGENNE